jgi:hypothetical protein
MANREDKELIGTSNVGVTLIFTNDDDESFASNTFMSTCACLNVTSVGVRVTLPVHVRMIPYRIVLIAT